MPEIEESTLKLYSTRGLLLSMLGLCYPVRRSYDGRNCVTYNIYQSQLVAYLEQGAHHLAAYVDVDTPDKKVFAIPFNLLINRILPECRKWNGKYRFQIRRDTYEFTWQAGPRGRGLKMQGNLFLVIDDLE